MPTEDFSRFLSIKLEEKEPFQQYSCDGLDVLGSLSLINIFIGTNNSGKSRLLRGLFELPHYQYKTPESSEGECYRLVEGIKKDFYAIMQNGTLSMGSMTISYLDPVLKKDWLFSKQGADLLYDDTKRLIEGLISLRAESVIHKNTMQIDPEQLTRALQDLGRKANMQFQKIKRDDDIGDERRFYIPILRGMRPFGTDKKDHYKERTKADYFKSLGSKCEIVTGLDLYQTLKEKLLGEPEDREAVKSYEGFLSEKFFGSRAVTLIPHEKDSVVYIKIGDDAQFPIYNLGDGLQNLIICTFYVFMQKERCLFFIEEPDMSMHPSMQRTFLEVLSQFDQHQYFLTTHSNHLLDLTFDFSDISVFHFAKGEGKEAKFKIHAASTGDQSILRDLGVRNSSVFLANSTIWVEGITDRLYLRAYMSKYCKELAEEDELLAKRLGRFREDLHYSFVEYQGSTLTHWGFDPDDQDLKRIKATYICAHAFLVADGDNAGKGGRKEIYSKMLEDRFYLLDVKEIENLIPEAILRKLVEEEFQEQQKALDLIRDKNYSKKTVGIGKYLDSLLGIKGDRGQFAEHSGTIKNKVKFCERAVELMSDEDFEWQLTPKAKELCERIFAHIEKENSAGAV